MMGGIHKQVWSHLMSLRYGGVRFAVGPVVLSLDEFGFMENLMVGTLIIVTNEEFLMVKYHCFPLM